MEDDEIFEDCRAASDDSEGATENDKCRRNTRSRLPVLKRSPLLRQTAEPRTRSNKLTVYSVVSASQHTSVTSMGDTSIFNDQYEFNSNVAEEDYTENTNKTVMDQSSLSNLGNSINSLTVGMPKEVQVGNNLSPFNVYTTVANVTLSDYDSVLSETNIRSKTPDGSDVKLSEQSIAAKSSLTQVHKSKEELGSKPGKSHKSQISFLPKKSKKTSNKISGKNSPTSNTKQYSQATNRNSKPSSSNIKKRSTTSKPPSKEQIACCVHIKSDKPAEIENIFKCSVHHETDKAGNSKSREEYTNTDLHSIANLAVQCDMITIRKQSDTTASESRKALRYTNPGPYAQELESLALMFKRLKNDIHNLDQDVKRISSNYKTPTASSMSLVNGVVENSCKSQIKSLEDIMRQFQEKVFNMYRTVDENPIHRRSQGYEECGRNYY